MIALVGSIGWGLLTMGAVTHVWHHRRLRSLLAVHLDHEKFPAAALTAVEAVLAVALAASYLGARGSLGALAVAAFVVAVGFIVWIARLLLTGSTLPCACSFSQNPTSVWSLARAICVALVILLAWAGEPDSTSMGIATLATGLACAAAIFVVPEALSWPSPSRALLARVDAHQAPPTP